MPGVLRRQPGKRALVSQFTHHHIAVFLLTFFSYSLLHASRKTFSNVKVSISSQWTPFCLNDTGLNLQPYELWNSSHLFPNIDEATLFLGTLDTIFLFSYAVGLYVSGVVGDHLNMRWVLSFGMCSSALVVFVFGTVTEWLHFYNKWFYCCLWIVNGLLQSTGWPCVVAVMGNWFGKAGRGFVFGLWSACASVGNILGAFLASSVLQYGYEYAFLVTASVQFAGGVVVFFGLVISPKEVGLPDVGEEEEGPAEEDASEPLMAGDDSEDDDDRNYTIQAADLSSSSSTTQPKPIGFFQACCLPGVLLYSFAYACLKLVNYSFFFWLPFYLSSNFGWKEAEADKLSIWYDVGGIIGGTIQGLISDMLQKRAPVLAISLILAVASLFGYSRSPNSKPINAVIMAITGFFIGGPSNMISSAISADLGRQEVMKGSSEALATVTGIVDGTGSIGAAVGQYLVSLIKENLGWMWVFYFFILMTSSSVLFITPLIVREIHMLLTQRHLRRLAG
ncbi:sugar phosphate exchanger 3 [Hemicordylus capensis]|uniref:sugar phosphate exchanger 3 n=1 Tax=Hemicordylus capensis TaxID=884348 RepID=UPI002302E60B|nr:sugar phosphate exchanger 3 [Hemicordylus capensis]XP_053110734.1 sugar phosphate exchanger 3 [Hemicordylus capensis]XP_053110735.1 sugar phosphate exchanger 3 [Hemicordylus capensis]XP_053110736.1 sugar phosphate exchanger 3 [Hemicordylus capensis]XP_053110737.1 sugar phosphate exchanger 3 [Hemicordylus capensis]